MNEPQVTPGPGAASLRQGPLVLVALLLVTALSATAFALTTSRGEFAKERQRLGYDLIASSASEAGISAALFDLRQGGSGNVGREGSPVRLGRGAYWAESTRLEGGCWSLTAVGTAGEARYRTELLARPVEGGLTFETVSLHSAIVSGDDAE